MDIIDREKFSEDRTCLNATQIQHKIVVNAVTTTFLGVYLRPPGEDNLKEFFKIVYSKEDENKAFE